MSWEKVGVTIVSKPAAHGSGLYLRIPKKMCEAYELFAAQVIEFTIERVRRPETGNDTLFRKCDISKTEKRKEEGGGR